MQVGDVSTKVADAAAVIGILVAVVGIASAATKRRAFALGIVALAMAFVAAAAGVLGTAADRRATDRDAAQIALRGTRRMTLHDGYADAQSRARRGARDAMLPLVLGALAAMLGTRKSESALRRRTTAAAACVAMLTTGGAWAASRSPIPPLLSRSTVELLDARDLVDTEFRRGCHELERAAASRWPAADRKEWPRRFAPDPRVDVPDFDVVATRCLQQRFVYVVGTGDADALLGSPLLVDDGLRAAMTAYIPPCRFGCVPSGDPDDSTDGYGHLHATWPILRVGAPATSGHMPMHDLREVLASYHDTILGCEGPALSKDPAYRFRTTLKLTVGREARVTAATLEPMPERELSKCVLDVARTMRFFFDEPSFTIDVPLVFDAH